MSNPQEPPQPEETGFAPSRAAESRQQLRARNWQSGQAPGNSSADTPFGLPGRPPARNRRKLWIILGSVGGVLLLVVLGIIILVKVVGSATNQARGLADDFTEMVIAGETSQAYDDYLDPALQELLSKEGFISGIQSLEMDESCKPSYDNLQVTTENGVKAADVAGIISCDGKEVDLAYRFEGTDELKIIDIKLRPKT